MDKPILFSSDMVLDNGIILKKIPNSPSDDYRAGSDGQIYSCKKYATHGPNSYSEWHVVKGYMQGGYPNITICKDGIRFSESVHRLVCLAFHGLPPSNSSQVRHLDSNIKNSKPDNLCWGTQEENWADRKEIGHGNEGDKHPLSKFTNFERQALQWSINKNLVSQRHAAKMLGVSQHAIWLITHHE